MLILSEVIHLLLTGIGLGVSFASKDKDEFVPLLIAVYAHEIPCAIGCVGILLKAKFSNCQTVVFNTLINVSCFIGVLIGMGIGKTSAAALNYILCFVAGNFIYIGAAIWRKLMKQDSFCLNFLEFFSVSLGVGAMYLVLLAKTDHGH